MRLLEVLSEKFKSQHTTLLSLQASKLIREQNENTEEWMSCLRLKESDYKYKEKDMTQWTIN